MGHVKQMHCGQIFKLPGFVQQMPGVKDDL